MRARFGMVIGAGGSLVNVLVAVARVEAGVMILLQRRSAAVTWSRRADSVPPSPSLHHLHLHWISDGDTFDDQDHGTHDCSTKPVDPQRPRHATAFRGRWPRWTGRRGVSLERCAF